MKMKRGVSCWDWWWRSLKGSVGMDEKIEEVVSVYEESQAGWILWVHRLMLRWGYWFS